MKKQLQYILITTAVFIAVIFSISSNYYRILYVKDAVQGYVVNKLPFGNAKPYLTIINHGEKKNYVHAYSTLPPELFHSGPFLFYRAGSDISIKELISQVIRYTEHLYARSMEQSFRRLNGIEGTSIHQGDVVLVPEPCPAYVPDIQNYKKPSLIYTRGLYYTGNSMRNGELLDNLDILKRLGINAIVFDVKDITGIVTYKSSLDDVIELGTHRQRSVDNMNLFIRMLKDKGFYTIARIAVFRDRLLVENAPSMAIRSYSTGKIWNRGSKELWCDPTSKRVQDYNIRIALELTSMGVDEIQFDYIRFPTVGNLQDAHYRYDYGRMSKKMTITHFLKRAYHEISRHNSCLSIDIFGVVAWGKNVDIRKTGQQIELLAQYCDVISPMLYPSHFNDDFDGLANPGDHPYHFIFKGCKKVIELSRRKITVRPWLQAFSWRVSRYDSEYILEQIRGSHDAGAWGYLFWNARNNYREVLEAMSKMQKYKASTALHSTGD